MTIVKLVNNLKALGIVNADGELLTYKEFKNRATIFPYSRNRRILFVGIPNKNLFGVYVRDNSTHSIAMKEGYNLLNDFVKGDETLFNEGRIQWGNTGIPSTYANLSKKVK